MKTKSKYILLLFVGIIVMLFGGIFFTVQQEKEGPITADAASSYWATPSVCPECGEAPDNYGGLNFTRQSGCTYSYTHEFNRGGGKHSGTISIHTAQSHPKVEPTCTAKGHEMYVDCVYCHTLNMTYIEIPALGHNYGDWFVATPATCTQNGMEQRQCSRCSARETRTIEATGHTWGSGTVTVSATCQRTGTRKYECTACGETKTETIAKRSHNYNIYLSRIEPTCTASGRTAGYECQWCYANTCSTIPALGHDLEYHDGQPATCTEAGWNNYETCSRCEYTTYREIAATGHTPGAAATCTTPQTCTECGAILVEALGHKTVSHLGQDATCTEAGWKPYETCENCDYTTYEEIPALGHSFTSYVSNNDATCTEDGTETAKCDRCDVTDTRTDEGSALGHDWAEEWITDGTAHWHECTRCDEINDKANHSGGTATCIELAECEVCGVEYGEFAEHVYVENAEEQYLVSAATCTTKATYYKSCSVCGEAGEEIFEFGDPLGHSYGEPEWTWEGYTSATAKFTCAHGCGDVQTVAASGGSITSEITTPAECEKEGLRTYTAKVLFGGEEYITTTAETLESLGHSFTSYVSNNDATCTEDGTETAKCDRCNVTDTRTDDGSALGHDWAVEWTTDGTSHWHKCSRCNEINDKANHSGGTATCIAHAKCEICGAEYGDFAEHVYVENAEERYLVSEATCTAKATYYKSCSVCGEAGEEVFEHGEPLGHEYGEPDWTWEDYTSATATFTCTREDCGDKQTATASGSSITSVVTTPAECEAEGMRTYNAKVMFGGEEYVTTTTETLEALGHDLEHHEAKPATCTEIGWEAYDTCTRCDYTTYVEIEALGHDWAEEWTTDGTAHWHECSRCDEINDKANHSGGTATCIALAKCEICGVEYGDLAEHVYVENAEEQYLVSAATCTAKATYYKSCSVCGEAGEEIFEYGEPLGHEYGEPEWTWEGYTSATATFTCTREDCGDKQTATASGSSITNIVTTPAECETEGLRTYTAKIMFGGEEYVTTTTETIPALEHVEDEAVRENEVPASCTAAGSYDEVIYCSVCGEELSREEKVIDALGHSFTSYVSDNNATCTEDGTETAKCDRCEVTDTRTDEGSALGHDWAEEWTTDGTAHWHECSRCDEINDKANHSGGEATCTNPAECEVCGAEYGEALGHDLQHHEAQAATCTEIGWNAYDTCSRCDYTTYEEIPALGHTEGAPVRENEAAATCTAAGSYDEVVYCSVCGEELSREEKTIEALGHTEGAPVRENEAAATCTAAGSYDEVVYCSVCGEELSRAGMTIEALGHDIVKHEGQAATCTQNGWNDYETCSRCDYTTYREIAATGHTPGTAATCTSAQRCTVCGTTLTPARGHNFVDGYCTVCGVIDSSALETDKDDAKTDLDDAAQDAKDEIDASDLPDDVKDDLKDKVDEIVDGAKDEVDGSTDFDDVDQAIEDAKDEIEDAILDAEKDDAKSDLDDIAQSAKDEIDGSHLPDEVKDDLRDKVDEIVNDAKTEIDGEASKEEVDQTVEDTRQEIEDAILAAEKDDAKSDLDEIAQSAKDEIDASDLPDDVKDELKGKVDAAVEEAKEAIDNATSKEEVENIVNDTREDIDDLLKGGLDNELAEKKDTAISDLTEIAQGAKDEIAGSDVSDEEKDELKGKVDEIVNKAKAEIEAATTPEGIEEVLSTAKEEITVLTEDLTTVQPDMDALWLWIIVAIVISAALSALAAWKIVKDVRVCGETVGVKTVVKIGITTILIFILIIGIALVMFALI